MDSKNSATLLASRVQGQSNGFRQSVEATKTINQNDTVSKKRKKKKQHTINIYSIRGKEGSIIKDRKKISKTVVISFVKFHHQIFHEILCM